MTKFEEKKKEAYEKASMKYFGNADGSRAMRYLLNELENAGLLKEQQALPVVPECVAEWYEEKKNKLELAVYKINTSIDKKSFNDLTKIEEWFEGVENKPIETIFKMKDGYTIEKPQLFYIELPKVFGLSDSTFVSKAESGIISEFTKGKNYALKFTEQEIKSIDERYWQFAVPVEDGE